MILVIGLDQILRGVVVGRDHDIRLPGLDDRLRFEGALRLRLGRLPALGIHVELPELALAFQNRTQAVLDAVRPGVSAVIGGDEQASLAGGVRAGHAAIHRNGCEKRASRRGQEPSCPRHVPTLSRLARGHARTRGPIRQSRA